MVKADLISVVDDLEDLRVCMEMDCTEDCFVDHGEAGWTCGIVTDLCRM